MKPDEQGQVDQPVGSIRLRTKGAAASRAFANEIAAAFNASPSPHFGGGDHNQDPPLVTEVTVTDDADGGGQYEGTFYGLMEQDVDVTVDVGASGETNNLGTPSKCFIRNQAERGASTHRLTESSSALPTPPLLGIFFGWARDGEGADAPRLPVYTVNYVRRRQCAS